MDGNSAGQPQRGALFGPWPCHPDGTSTVPPLDRVQVNKIRSHLSQIFVAETHDCHLVQAIREQLLPSQIYQLIHASADSITWTPHRTSLALGPTDDGLADAHQHTALRRSSQ